MDVGLQHGSGLGKSRDTGSGNGEGSRFGGLLLFGTKQKEEKSSVSADDVARTPPSIQIQADLGGREGNGDETFPPDQLPAGDAVAAAIVWTSVDPESRFERDGEVQGNSPRSSEESSEVVEPASVYPESLSVLAEDFERRSRKSATMSRLLEQHRRHLATAQNERAELYDKLQQVIPVIQQSTDTLREAMNGRRFEAAPQHFRELFEVNERALNELGTLATALTADFMWLRSAWDQYTRSMQEAQRLT